jgi:hypothetical protein
MDFVDLGEVDELSGMDSATARTSQIACLVIVELEYPYLVHGAHRLVLQRPYWASWTWKIWTVQAKPETTIKYGLPNSLSRLPIPYGKQLVIQNVADGSGQPSFATAIHTTVGFDLHPGERVPAKHGHV